MLKASLILLMITVSQHYYLTAPVEVTIIILYYFRSVSIEELAPETTEAQVHDKKKKTRPVRKKSRSPKREQVWKIKFVVMITVY